jgi:hypothetical protein
LAVSIDGNEVFIATVDEKARVTTIHGLSLRNLSRRTVATVHDSVAYRLIDVGRRSGSVYLFGGLGVRVLRFDPSTGAEQGRWMPMDSLANWWVYAAAVSADEQRVFLSYHGGKWGMDWLDIGTPAGQLCRASEPHWGCIMAHGAFALYRDHIVVATGAELLVEVDQGGREIARYPLDLANNHVMEFALDTVEAIAYGIGPCYYTGGLAAVAIREGRSRPVSSARVGSVCGDRIALASDRKWIVVASRNFATPSPFAPGVLTVVSATTGEIARRIALTSEAVDVLIACRGGA